MSVGRSASRRTATAEISVADRTTVTVTGGSGDGQEPGPEPGQQDTGASGTASWWIGRSRPEEGPATLAMKRRQQHPAGGP